MFIVTTLSTLYDQELKDFYFKLLSSVLIFNELDVIQEIEEKWERVLVLLHMQYYFFFVSKLMRSAIEEGLKNTTESTPGIINIFKVKFVLWVQMKHASLKSIQLLNCFIDIDIFINKLFHAINNLLSSCLDKFLVAEAN